MTFVRSVKEGLADLRDFAGDLVEMFREAVNPTPEPTPEEILGHFSYYLKQKVERDSQPFSGYQKQEEYDAEFRSALHLVVEGAQQNNAEFLEAAAQLLDKTNEQDPATAISAASILDSFCIASAAFWRVRMEDRTPVADYSSRVSGLEALGDLVESRQEFYTMAVAEKSPETILNWAVTGFDLNLANPRDSERKKDRGDWFMNLVLNKIHISLVMDLHLAKALRSIDLNPFFEARPVDVLVATAELSRMGSDNDRGQAQAAYDSFKARVSGHPEAVRIGYFTEILEGWAANHYSNSSPRPSSSSVPSP